MEIQEFCVEFRGKTPAADGGPCFSWKLKREEKDVIQERYQIQVISGGHMVYDTGIVESSQTELAPCGLSLRPVTVYHAQVCVWDSRGETGQAVMRFETGLA